MSRIAALFACLLYLPSLLCGYTIDDHSAITGHPAVTGAAPLWQVFVREFWGHRPGEGIWSSSFRPVTSLSFALCYRLTAAPWLQHLGNVLLFAALCALLVRLARRFLPEGPALCCGLLFAALPIHAESVASLVGRADILMAIFALLALELTWDHPTRPLRLLLAGLCFALAFFAKEGIILLPLLMGWLAVVRGQRPWRRPAALVPALCVGLCALACFAVRRALFAIALPPSFVAADNQLVGVRGLARLWGNLAVLGRYLELTVVPARLCADHTYADLIPPRALLDAGWPLAVLGLGALLAVLWDAQRALRGRGGGLLSAAFLAYLLVGQWLVDLSVLMAERLLLWPSLWLVLAAGALLPERLTRRSAALLAVLLLLLSARTVQHTLAWRDDLSIARESVESCPASVRARLWYGDALRDAGQAEEAVWQYGLAAAGRTRFPAPLDFPAFAAEETQPIAQRLPQLPGLVGMGNARWFWGKLRHFLELRGAAREASIAAALEKAVQ